MEDSSVLANLVSLAQPVRKTLTSVDGALEQEPPARRARTMQRVLTLLMSAAALHTARAKQGIIAVAYLAGKARIVNMTSMSVCQSLVKGEELVWSLEHMLLGFRFKLTATDANALSDLKAKIVRMIQMNVNLIHVLATIRSAQNRPLIAQLLLVHSNAIVPRAILYPRSTNV